MDIEVNRKLIKVVRSIYRNEIAKVQINGQRSEVFEMKIEVKQEYNLNPQEEN